MGKAHQMNPTKKFTLSSGAKVDVDDEDPEAKNQLEKKASVMLPTFYIPKPDSIQCSVHTHLLNVPSIELIE